MYILKHYFKPEKKTDNSDFTKFGMKIGPVPDIQGLPYCITQHHNSVMQQSTLQKCITAHYITALYYNTLYYSIILQHTTIKKCSVVHYITTVQCSTLHSMLTTVYFSKVQYTAVHCTRVQCSSVYCSNWVTEDQSAMGGIIPLGILSPTAFQYSTVALQGIALHCRALQYTALVCIVLHMNILQSNAVQFSGLQFFSTVQFYFSYIHYIAPFVYCTALSYTAV